MEELQYCSNCEKNIAKSKFVLHERCCSQNVKKCSICHVPINIEDEEDHFNECHSNLTCIHCKKQFTKEMIASHRKQCDQIMEECMYCTIQVSKKDRKEHELACGSKTELCPKCIHYISKKDQRNHNSSNCCPDELEANKQLVYIDETNKRKHLKKDKSESSKEVSSIADKTPFQFNYNDLISSIDSTANETSKSKASHKKFDMQVGSINDKENRNGTDSQVTLITKDKKQSLGKSMSKPGFVKQESKLNQLSSQSSKSIGEKAIEKRKDRKPQINKISSFNSPPLAESGEVNKHTPPKIKKKKKKQFLPLNKYDIVDVSEDDYDYDEDYFRQPYQSATSQQSSYANSRISAKQKDFNEAIKRSLIDK